MTLNLKLRCYVKNWRRAVNSLCSVLVSDLNIVHARILSLKSNLEKVGSETNFVSVTLSPRSEFIFCPLVDSQRFVCYGPMTPAHNQTVDQSRNGEASACSILPRIFSLWEEIVNGREINEETDCRSTVGKKKRTREKNVEVGKICVRARRLCRKAVWLPGMHNQWGSGTGHSADRHTSLMCARAVCTVDTSSSAKCSSVLSYLPV